MNSFFKSFFGNKVKVAILIACVVVIAAAIIVACNWKMWTQSPDDSGKPSTETNADANVKDEEDDNQDATQNDENIGDGTEEDDNTVDGENEDSQDENNEDVQGDTNTEDSEDTQQEPNTGTPNIYYSEDGYEVYDPYNSRGLDTTKNGFGCGNASNGQAHDASKGVQAYFDSLEGVDALVWHNTTEKIIYLTFDCGYEYNDNTLKILDILKEKDTPAAFFCTLHFLKTAPEATRRIIEEGHILGNHSASHPSFPTISRVEMADELFQVAKHLKDNYNYDCSYFRPPMGEYSEDSLDLCTSVGYRSVLWSFAHIDWYTDDQPSYDETMKVLKDRLHPGAVMLLHSVSDANVSALADFIDYARANGYTFVTLDDYPW